MSWFVFSREPEEWMSQHKSTSTGHVREDKADISLSYCSQATLDHLLWAFLSVWEHCIHFQSMALALTVTYCYRFISYAIVVMFCVIIDLNLCPHLPAP